MLTKLIPLILLGGLAVKGVSMGSEQMEFVKNYTKISATQSETRNIQKLIMVEVADTGQLPPDWCTVVTDQTRVQENRDPCIDIWGTSYEIWGEPETFVVGSAGPDGSFESEDDIVAK